MSLFPRRLLVSSQTSLVILRQGGTEATTSRFAYDIETPRRPKTDTQARFEAHLDSLKPKRPISSALPALPALPAGAAIGHCRAWLTQPNTRILAPGSV